MPASPITSVTIGWKSWMPIHPGPTGRPGVGTEFRNGNERTPVRSARRAGPVGIASGTASEKLSESSASASRFGVFARLFGL